MSIMDQFDEAAINAFGAPGLSREEVKSVAAAIGAHLRDGGRSGAKKVFCDLIDSMANGIIAAGEKMKP